VQFRVVDGGVELEFEPVSREDAAQAVAEHAAKA
jgi:hypothetical protein